MTCSEGPSDYISATMLNPAGRMNVPSITAQQVVENISCAVIFVEVKKPDGTLDIGSAFHIGNGYFVTARHVIAGNEILKVGRSDTSLKTHSTATHTFSTSTHGSFTHSVIEGVFHHPDDKVDVSIFRLGGEIPIGQGYPASHLQPAIQLNHQTDLMAEGQFLLKEVVVLGYPPIPCADVHMVVFRGEVSAVIENRYNHQRQFVISGMARGGFSGGPVLSLDCTALGVVTESLSKNGESLELGFISATSAKTVFDIIAHHKLVIPSTS